MAKKDLTKTFADMFSAYPFDAKAMNDAWANAAAFGEKFSKVAIEAAEQSLEISNKWAKDALAKTATVTKAQKEPADYARVLADVASSNVESTAEYLAAFAEVAKKAQVETVELMLAAGKEAQAEATAAVKKATEEATAAVKKAANAPKAA